MTKNKNLIYYLLMIGIFILFKIWFIYADNTSLAFILKPTSKLVGMVTGSSSIYLDESGYYFQDTNIIIDKSCSGFNFWLLCYTMLFFLVLKSLHKNSHKLLAIPAVMLGAYILTILVNTSRIFVSLTIQNSLISFLQIEQHIIHETIGVITNLSFLILFFFTMKNYLTKLELNEQLT